MKASSKALRILERGFVFLGSLLLVVFAFAHIHRFLEAAKGGTAGIEATDGTTHNADLHQAQNPDYSLWSNRRTKLHQASLRKPVESLAVLRIPTLRLEVPLLEGTDEVTLNRGVGRIAGTSTPGQGGNMGIAGHRDGFFRRLKDIRTGDAIELVTISGTDVFVVDQIRITNPTDVSVLRPRAKRSLTLVTCYPFYFVGPAPSRYIVEASLQGQAEQDEEQQGRPLLLEGENQ